MARVVFVQDADGGGTVIVELPTAHRMDEAEQEQSGYRCAYQEKKDNDTHQGCLPRRESARVGKGKY